MFRLSRCGPVAGAASAAIRLRDGLDRGNLSNTWRIALGRPGYDGLRVSGTTGEATTIPARFVLVVAQPYDGPGGVVVEPTVPGSTHRSENDDRGQNDGDQFDGPEDQCSNGEA